MAAGRYDVNDIALREAFLREGFLDALAPLAAGAAALWGGMSPQQMVEHLAWSFAISSGAVQIECPVPEAERERIKPFLRRNTPMPRGFANPLLVNGLPPLRHTSLPEAKEALREELERFFLKAHTEPMAMRTHPVFGPIGVEDWSRIHYKHCQHHLLQFGLLEAPESKGP